MKGEDHEMNRKPLHRTAGVALLVALAATAFACGGGGGGNPTPPPLNATFTASNPTPGANSLNMTGASSGAMFTVNVNVTTITDFFGAGFRVTFNPATAAFNGISSDNSILPAGAEFRGSLVGPGELTVAATLKGQVQGVTVNGTQLLVTLIFTATAETPNNPFTFGVAVDRVVTTCPAPPGACSDIPDATLNWIGGTMSASR